MSDMIRGNCPFCGKPLEIPGELEEFSCLFCGKRSRTEILSLQRSVDEGSLREDAAALAKALEHRQKLAKKVNKKDYPSNFQAFETEQKSRLTRLDLAVCGHPSGIKSASALAAQVFLDALDQELMADKRYGNKITRATVLLETKIVLALFLTPLVKKLHLRFAEDFCTQLHRQWMERYPRENWMPGDYEVIMAGFRKKGLCFITTATCRHEGKADDCRELTAFRAFRDGWMQEQGDQALIEEYYSIAPSIVTLIDHCDDPESCYGEIRSRWLEPCLRALDRGDASGCRSL